MKKLETIILIAAIVLLSCSCKSIMMRFKGVTSPKKETEQSILFYMKRSNISRYDGLDIGKDSINYFPLLKTVRNLPSVDFFTPNGKLINYYESSDCAGKAEKFISGLSLKNKVEIDSSYQLNDIVNKVKPLRGGTVINTDNADFILLIYWAKFLGSMNKSVLNLVDDARRNTQVRFKIYLINLDVQANWGMKNKIEFKPK